MVLNSTCSLFDAAAELTPPQQGENRATQDMTGCRGGHGTRSKFSTLKPCTWFGGSGAVHRETSWSSSKLLTACEFGKRRSSAPSLYWKIWPRMATVLPQWRRSDEAASRWARRRDVKFPYAFENIGRIVASTGQTPLTDRLVGQTIVFCRLSSGWPGEA